MCLIILDIWQGFEYASGIKYAKVLNMLQYSSYSSITVVVSNFIILEVSSARFVHPGVPQLTIISFLTLVMYNLYSEVTRFHWKSWFEVKV